MKKNINSLTRKIKHKFGSYHNFARLVGLDSLRSKTPIQVNAIVDRMSRTASGGRILPEKLSLLKSKISALGGVEAFCSENEGFSMVSVYQIIQGRRKRISPVVARLFKHFGI